MHNNVTKRNLKTILPILIGFFVVTGFICLPTPQRFIEDLRDENSQWIDQSGVDASASVIKSALYSMPALMSEPRTLSNHQSVVVIPYPEQTLGWIPRFYRHVLVARAP